MKNTTTAKKVLRKVLGLDTEQIDKVLKTIASSGNGGAVVDSAIRRRMGSSAVTMLNRALSTAAGDSKVKKADADDAKKDSDNVNEGFKAFFVAEAMLDVDLNDMSAATAAVRKAARLGNNPARLSRMEIQNAHAKTKAARDAENGPTKSLQMQIARKTEELAMLNKRLRDAQARQA